MFAEPNLVERTIRDFMTEEIGGIVVDDKAACKQITDTLKRIGGAKMAEKVTFYNSPKPIFDHYRINDQLREVYQREVRLPGRRLHLHRRNRGADRDRRELRPRPEGNRPA